MLEKYEQDYASIQQDFLLILRKVSRNEADAASALLQYDNKYRRYLIYSSGTFTNKNHILFFAVD